ncbi:MAG TPA: invasion associated locus B family protein [Stellaceae bacterium]|nr:invasion associated locus B family protein [Stellaceae bacterium]
MATRSLFALAVLGLLLAAAPAAAAAKKKPAEAAPAVPSADPGPAKPLGSAGAWSAYLAQNKAGKVCYVVSQPERSEPAAARRKPAMAMVTHRTQDNVSNVVSFDEGYPLNESEDVVVDVGPEKFTLFANNDTAWARTSDLDKTIVEALSKGKEAVVRATPKKGHATTDTYSLAGFSKALDLIDKACGVKR